MEGPHRFDNQAGEFKQPPRWSYRRFSDMVPARVVLYILSFSGFLISFMMRADMNMAMVAMARAPSDNSTATIDNHCYANSDNSSTGESNNENEQPEFEWDSTIQNTIISSFYWCYILSQIVGGVLTQYFGTKTVFGGSQLLTAICSLLMPTAANLHWGALVALRSIQGIASGITWPAMYAIVGHWIPPVERSRFMSSFQGFSVGIGLTYYLSGVLIYYFGWRTVFYTTGSIGVAWCVVWFIFAFDTPASHPRISQQERQYIESSVGTQVVGTNEETKVPWPAILTSMPAWAIAITTFGRIWVNYVFFVSGPMYMKTVLNYSIKDNGWASGAPFICSWFSSVIFCYVADKLVTRRIMSLLNVRKLFTAMSQIVPGLLLLLVGYLDCNKTLILIVWFIAVTFITAAYAGAMANIVDIAPNLAGPTLAFAQTIHMSASFLSPMTTGYITKTSLTLGTWREVFWLAAVMGCVTYVVYQIFGSANIQAWNYPNQKLPQRVNDDIEPLNISTQNGKIIPRKVSNAESA